MKKIVWLAAVMLLTWACNNKKANYIDPRLFLNPQKEFRAVPFYSLNDELDTAVIHEQLKSFSDAGFGGVFLHSRIGLLTEYLGKDWWEAMDAGVNRTKELKMDAWFYDEDKWPSGFAGGIVPRMNIDYHAHSLQKISIDSAVPAGDKLLFSDTKYKYIDHKMYMGSAWYNGTCWVDLMNPAAVKAFIDTTYGSYAKRYKSYFGKTVKGIFTDEPQINPQDDGSIYLDRKTFSPLIVERFKQEHGYDMISRIPELFDTIGDYKIFRIHYYRTIANAFEESFSKQIGEYCKANNIIWTGHYWEEESPKSAAYGAGNIMTQYRHMQMPGIDHLFLRINGDLNGAKGLSSVANQYGIERRISEAFGVSGQNMSFEDRKWIVDWHTINGINFICPHLSLYSMKGERKRDYPPTFTWAQPYWSYNKIIEDYTARLCYVNTIGKPANDILVMVPLESAYIESANNSCDATYLKILEKLMEGHHNFDLGDEQILADTGNVISGNLVIGSMNYKTVILPTMLTIRETTLNLLQKFKKQGGTIIIVDSYPKLINGKSDLGQLNWLKSNSNLSSTSEISNILESHNHSPFIIGGDGNESIYSSCRLVDDGMIIQVSNTSRLRTLFCNLGFTKKQDDIVLWDPIDGSYMRLRKDDNGYYSIQLAPSQTYIITTGKASAKAKPEKLYRLAVNENILAVLGGNWNGKRLDPNAITLDFAEYSTDGGKKYSTPEPVIGIHERLTSEKYNGDLSLRYLVNIESIPVACSLVVEQPQLFSSIQVNGKNYSFINDGFYRDQTFRKSDLKNLLVKGKNNIVFNLKYKAPISNSYIAKERYGTEIESIYLIGDFGVSAKPSNADAETIEKNKKGIFVQKPVNRFSSFSITSELNVFGGDLAKLGYPFFAGSFELSTKLELPERIAGRKYFLYFPSAEAIVIKALINGQEIDNLVWNPWEADITKAMKPGVNEIQLVLSNSLRNLLGPHHHKGGELVGVGPLSFTGQSFWTNPEHGENNWYELRKTGKANLWRDDYFCIPFGILSEPVITERSY